jgi:small multidrug resistance pump
MKPIMFGLIFGLVALESLAQYLSRKYTENRDKLWMFVVAVICYLLIVYTLTKTYDYENIGFVNALWSGLALVSVAMIGYFFFEERFNNQEYAAIGLILAGTILLGIQK